jgi:diguanylate cyclase (GGDEF)-like protein
MTSHGEDMSDEARRLLVLGALDLLSERPEAEFDALTSLAAQILGAPIAAITLIDADRQHVMSRSGFEGGDMPRKDSFCTHAIRERGLMIVPDTHMDPRFVDNPLVTGDPNARFYAGAPIRARVGEAEAAIGALCVVDRQPRSLTPEQQEALTRLAKLAEALIDARAAAREALALAQRTHDQAVVLRRQERIFQHAERIAMIGAWRYDHVAGELDWSDGVRRIHEVRLGYQPRLDDALTFYPSQSRTIIEQNFTHCVETGEPFDVETDFVTATGKHRRVRSMGEAERIDGETVAVIGVFQDVTARHQLEQELRRSAHVDALTGIANRAAFNHQLEVAFGRAARTGSALSLVLIDLDGFKTINDTYGHMVGDDVLRGYGARLRSEWLADSFPARLGGDEFALVLEGAATRDTPARVARLLALLSRPIPCGDRLLKVTGTIGWAAYAPDMVSVRDLIHTADTALYEAKRERRGSAREAGRA